MDEGISSRRQPKALHKSGKPQVCFLIRGTGKITVTDLVAVLALIRIVLVSIVVPIQLDPSVLGEFWFITHLRRSGRSRLNVWGLGFLLGLSRSHYYLIGRLLHEAAHLSWPDEGLLSALELLCIPICIICQRVAQHIVHELLELIPKNLVVRYAALDPCGLSP